MTDPANPADPADATAFNPGTPAPAPARRGRPEDLCAEIVQTVEKEPGDHVRCTHVANGNYRCNWWARQATASYDNPAMGGLLVTTHRVRKSRFLQVTRVAGRLVIRERPLR